jgi:hypothetical protein
VPAAEPREVAELRTILAERGFGSSVTEGPMAARAPGQATPFDFASDDDLDAQVGAFQPEAWLVRTEAGRWWLWPDGAAAPADRRAEAHEALGRARAKGRRPLD